MADTYGQMMRDRPARTLQEQFEGAFHAMTLDQRREAMERFNKTFAHEHCVEKFKVVEA